MERRKALAISAAIVATVAAGGVAFAANMGLLGFAGSDPAVGNLDARNVAELTANTATTDSTLPEVIVVDEYVNDSAGSGGTAATGSGTSPSSPSATVATQAPSGTVATQAPPPPGDDHDNGQYEDHEDGDHDGDHDDGDHEDEDHEGDEDDD